jgi:hypothetical protein
VERRLVLRRLLLIGTPLVLASFMVVHQLIDQLQQPGAFLVLHLILLPLFALMGVALWALLEGVGGAVAWAARVAAFVFLVGYVALDAISGIAASAILASGAPRGRRRLPGRCLPRGPRPSPPWWRSSLNQNHGGVRGVVVFGGFALAAAWLEFFPGGLRWRGAQGTPTA